MSQFKKLAKYAYFTLKGVKREFNFQTLPWIDKQGADISTFVKSFPKTKGYQYDLVEKLTFWQKNGYVILENAIPHEWIDKLLADFDDFLNHNEDFDKDVLVEVKGWDKAPIQKAKDVPKDLLRGQGIKVNDFYNLSQIGKKIMLHPAITTFLEAILDDKVVGMQSLNFNYGSQQPAHMDFPYVVSGIPSHLAAAWIALEDIHPDSGPLFYYVGSHKMPKFNWGNGIIYRNNESYYTPIDFSNWLENKCKQLGYNKEVLLIKKGDVLIWHAALVHGGTIINNPSQTRKSYVCHYSSKTAYPTHRFKPDETPKEFEYEGAVCYDHPFLQQEENYFKD